MNLVSMLASDNPVEHVVNHVGVSVDGWWVWSAHVGNLILSGILTILVLTFAANRIATGDPAKDGANAYVTRNPFAHMIEVICVYLREKVVRPLLHERTDTFMPILWTFFFFILINNLLGLIPILDLQHLFSNELRSEHKAYLGGTATGNIFVTGVLAVIAAIVINFAGVRELGVGGYVKHLTAGTPWYLWALMIPIEILGTFIKPVALALRLFANMNAGHILMATMFMFAGMGFRLGGLGYGITFISAIAAIAIYFLELFVALLQAFVFTFLVAVFISQLSHHGDHEDHGAHDHEHGRGAHAH